MLPNASNVSLYKMPNPAANSFDIMYPVLVLVFSRTRYVGRVWREGVPSFVWTLRKKIAGYDWYRPDFADQKKESTTREGVFDLSGGPFSRSSTIHRQVVQPGMV